mgnify:CR=1
MAPTLGKRRTRFRLLIGFLSFSLALSLGPVTFIQEVSAAPIAVTQCKLADRFNGSVRLGFPKDAARLSSTGNQRVLLLAVDYSDAPANENATEALKLAFDTDHINEFYKSAIDDLKYFEDNEFKESLKKLIKYVIERNY